MENEVERLVVIRRRLLWGCLIGYSIFLGAVLVKLSQPRDTSNPYVTGVELAGAAIATLSLLQIVALVVKLRANRPLANAICDEIWWANRYKAAFFAFTVLLPTQGLIVGLAYCAPGLLSVPAYALFNLLVAFVAFVGSFLYLDHKN